MEYATTTDPDTREPSVEFACPACGAPQRRPLSLGGEPSTCTECGAAFRVPGQLERERAEHGDTAKLGVVMPHKPTTEVSSPPRHVVPNWPVSFTVVGTAFRIFSLILLWDALTTGTGPSFSSTVNLGMMNDRIVHAVIGGALLIGGVLEAVGARVVKGLSDPGLQRAGIEPAERDANTTDR